MRGRGATAPDLDTALAVRAALAQLPAEQRVALVLLDMQGYSVAEIAADARRRRGHGEEPVRPRPGPAGRAARPPAPRPRSRRHGHVREPGGRAGDVGSAAADDAEQGGVDERGCTV